MRGAHHLNIAVGERLFQQHSEAVNFVLIDGYDKDSIGFQETACVAQPLFHVRS